MTHHIVDFIQATFQMLSEQTNERQETVERAHQNQFMLFLGAGF